MIKKISFVFVLLFMSLTLVFVTQRNYKAETNESIQIVLRFNSDGTVSWIKGSYDLLLRLSTERPYNNYSIEDDEIKYFNEDENALSYNQVSLYGSSDGVMWIFTDVNNNYYNILITSNTWRDLYLEYDSVYVWNHYLEVNYVDDDEMYTLGYNDGYKQGKIDGVRDGINQGFAQGYNQGLKDGEDNGYELGYDFAKNEWGYEVDGVMMNAYEYGQMMYNKALTENMETGGFMVILGSMFNAVGVLLSVELLPNITIGSFVLIPLVFGVVMFIIGKKKE